MCGGVSLVWGYLQGLCISEQTAGIRAESIPGWIGHFGSKVGRADDALLSHRSQPIIEQSNKGLSIRHYATSYTHTFYQHSCSLANSVQYYPHAHAQREGGTHTVRPAPLTALYC